MLCLFATIDDNNLTIRTFQGFANGIRVSHKNAASELFQNLFPYVESPRVSLYLC